MANKHGSKKALASVLASVAVAVGAVAACAPSSVSGVQAQTGSARTANKVVLTFWYWDSSGVEKLIPLWNKTHPDIQIKGQLMGWAGVHQKLSTTLAAGSGAPDLTLIDDTMIDSFSQNPDKFYDLNNLGANQIKSQHLSWNYKLGTASNGEQVGLPFGAGPTVMYYRVDLFKKAGLPTDPAQVAKTIKTWDEYIKAGEQLKKKTGAYMIDTPVTIFDTIRDQGVQSYFDRSNKLILGTNPQIKKALAYFNKVNAAGIGGKFTTNGGDAQWVTGLQKGSFATVLDGCWDGFEIEAQAPQLGGLWRVAPMPEGAGNYGGCMIALPKQGKYAADAMKVAEWFTNAENQTRVMSEIGFPSTPRSFTPSVTNQSVAYFGGQKVNQVYVQAAESAKVPYRGPQFNAIDTLVTQSLNQIVTLHKNPQQTWNNLLNQASRQLQLGGQ